MRVTVLSETLSSRSSRSSYGWLVSNTADDCLQRQIAPKIFKSKIKSRPVNTGHYMAFISFATDLTANFGCNRFRIIPDVISKLLRAAIWSRCAVWFESEQTPLSRTGHWLRSAALHRILFGTCCFVPISYFYSETNEWLKDWAKRWTLLWSATISRQFHRNFHFTWKSDSSLPDIYKALNLFDSRTESV